MKRLINIHAIAGIVSTKTGYKKSEVELILSESFSFIKKEMVNDNRVRVSGFGTFETILRKSKVAQDINRKKPIRIPTRLKAVFKPAKCFQESLNLNSNTNANS